LPKVGDTVALVHQLHDRDETKFVRAFVEDSDGVAIAGSPFTLTHDTLGKYRNNSLAMLDIAFISATYVVYNDALFDEISDDHTTHIDGFELVVLDQELVDCIEELKDKANQLLSKLDDLLGVNVIIEGEISQGDEIDGIVASQEDIQGIVDETTEVLGAVESLQSLTGTVGQEPEIIGEVEEDC